MQQYATIAEETAEKIVSQLLIAPNGSISPTALEVLDWQFQFQINKQVLGGLVGLGAAASAVYFAHGALTVSLPSLAFGI